MDSIREIATAAPAKESRIETAASAKAPRMFLVPCSSDRADWHFVYDNCHDDPDDPTSKVRFYAQVGSTDAGDIDDPCVFVPARFEQLGTELTNMLKIIEKDLGLSLFLDGKFYFDYARD